MYLHQACDTNGAWIKPVEELFDTYNHVILEKSLDILIHCWPVKASLYRSFLFGSTMSEDMCCPSFMRISGNDELVRVWRGEESEVIYDSTCHHSSRTEITVNFGRDQFHI